jgi:hypothetical protein
MADKLDSNEVVDLQELLTSGIIQSEALINLLDRNGITGGLYQPHVNTVGQK